LKYRSHSEILQDLQDLSNFAGFLAIFEVTDEANAGSGDQSEISLLHPQVLPTVFDEFTELFGIHNTLFPLGKISVFISVFKMFFPVR